MLFNFNWIKSSSLGLGLVALGWKIVDTVISLFAVKFIPYLGYFSYGPTMYQYGTPDYVRALTNFDGVFYIRIATQGYSYTEQAFFPLYPVILSWTNTLLHNPIIAGLAVSLISFVIGLFLWRQYFGYLSGMRNFPWALMLLLVYPTSYYFGVLYTESLFFALMVGTLLTLKRRQYLLSAILAYCAALTKVVGVFLILPIAVTFIREVGQSKYANVKELFWSCIKQWRVILVGGASLLGLSTYSFYLWRTLGDPLYFLHAQESFSNNRSSDLITPFQVVYRYFKIFVTADHNIQYYVAMAELVFYAAITGLILLELWNIWKKYRNKRRINYERLGLGLFSLASVMVPSLTGTLSAVPRYSLMSLTIFVVLAEIKQKWLLYGLWLLFLLLHVAYFALFIQGYYVT